VASASLLCGRATRRTHQKAYEHKCEKVRLELANPDRGRDIIKNQAGCDPQRHDRTRTVFLSHAQPTGQLDTSESHHRSAHKNPKNAEFLRQLSAYIRFCQCMIERRQTSGRVQDSPQDAKDSAHHHQNAHILML
jgi:hypothetical protein